MRWDDFRRSSNVEDDREASASRGGGLGIPGGGGGLGIGMVIILGLIGWALGIDPSVLIGGAEIFAANGRTYHPPKLRLFSGSEPTPCAFAKSAMGPFYCPRDQRVYLDTSFFNDLQYKFGGCSNSNACKFSEAYVIAHEVGHHVQDELGILPRVMQAQQAASSQADANALQVRVELQADCFAGVWANHAQQKHSFLDPGDVDQALQTASAIGDDRLQRETQGYVVPDAFTHGTSAQRKRWFMNGFNSGNVSDCNTLSADSL